MTIESEFSLNMSNLIKKKLPNYEENKYFKVKLQ